MRRYDVAYGPSTMYSKFERTPENYLRGKSIITSIGVFPYVKADGTMEYELRAPEDILDPESYNTLSLLPLSNEHPSEKITSENVDKYRVGTVGENVDVSDGIHVAVELVIQNQDAINDVMAGKRGLSCGYDTDVVPESGVYCGVAYTARQTNVRYNHISLCSRGRAGDAAVVHMDSTDAILVQDSQKEDRRMPETMKKIKIDGVEYEGEAKILESYTNAMTKADSLQTSLDALTAEKTKVEAERDTLKDTVEKNEAKIKELEATKVDAAAIEAAVARRVKVLEAAKFANVEVKDGMSEAEIQKAVILKVFPKATLDAKDQVYIDARFDGAVETFERDADAQTRQLGTETIVDGKDNTDSVVSAESARQKYLDRLNKKK